VIVDNKNFHERLSGIPMARRFKRQGIYLAAGPLARTS
jgi:hypothetical protein